MKKWIPVNENGQLWLLEEYTVDEDDPNLFWFQTATYAVVLNNKSFVQEASFPHTQREVFFDQQSGEITGHREIIYLV